VEYRLQVNDQPDFDLPVVDVLVSALIYEPAAPLKDATTYYWRVQALGGGDTVSLWSDAWTITIDIARPTAPALSSPTDRSNTTDTTPTFKWSKVTGAFRYQVQVDDDPSFGSPADIGIGR